ncbi:IclR family transcriptional regulator [uncultured Serinicoccus sp.]|uniref:IclR family transcriptional regulator n=1 Tax=uncultured Serinicoccus sp. TaxID=735514 RepID=UPI002636F732|nr:IclR family transcriptional regulator [uncultured Serinicoccus sp.]
MVSDNGSVRSVERVTAVLELLSARRRPMRLAEIAQELEMPKSTVHGLLHTLDARDFVRRDEEQRYRLSIRLFSLAATALGFEDLRDVARPAMRELSESTRGTASLAVLDGHEVVYLEKVEDRSSLVQVVTQVGTRVPAHINALGKALVGALPREERERWVDAHTFTQVTGSTVADPAAFRAQLATQDRLGYAVNDQELHPAVTAWAAPVRGHHGQVVAALSLAHLGSPPSAEQMHELGLRVRAAAGRVSEALRSD